MARYRNFFGIQSDEQLKREADELKKSGDFTYPDNFEVRHHPTPCISEVPQPPIRLEPPRVLLFSWVVYVIQTLNPAEPSFHQHPQVRSALLIMIITHP